jgi:hypothetical protein
MASDQNEIECFKIETTLRVTARSATWNQGRFDRKYRLASRPRAPAGLKPEHQEINMEIIFFNIF